MLIRKGVALLSVTTIATGWWYRPEPLPADWSDRKNVWRNKLTDNANQTIPIFVELSRKIVLFLGVTLFRSLMYYWGECEIQLDDNYFSFVSAVKNRHHSQPLITVSNHRSLLDDVTIFSSLFPYWMNIQPKFIRNSICAQEYCFNSNFHELVYGLVGLGKVLPILRGAGINQSLFHDFARLVAAGEWCHIYPEGGIWQGNSLGGRSNNEIGKLKWGVGKLIAHAPTRPIVVAIFFSGTEHMTPMDPISKKILSYIPKFGHRVKIIISAEISFDDLIVEHEKIHGTLWKYRSSVTSGCDEDPNDQWISTKTDHILYSKITRRIQSELERLNRQVFI